VAELLVQSLTATYLDTRYLSVRFGNVMGSSGSVVPIFQEQIRNGGPVTVTDPEATRYFMTIPEAGQLVLQAGAIARSGEVMVLDMGEPMRIIELAERLIELSGFRPYLDIEVELTGLKPGEKLHEELDTADEELVATQHAKIFATTDALGDGHSLADIQRLIELATDAAPDQVKAALSRLVPEADFQ
jgi:FlaA1/EpsC-like NDP-sugar epimerase